MKRKEGRFEKGFFTPSRFAVATQYLKERSHRKLYLASLSGAVALAALFLADAFILRGSTVIRPVSEHHAVFSNDCTSCHQPFAGTPDIKCASCHNTTNARGVYTFARHYEYRSDQVDRSAPSSREMRCGSCHREHQRNALLPRTADALCVSCHAFGSFTDGHPEFEFVKTNGEERANLKFPHLKHVREVMDKSQLDDAESACLRCHIPRPDGRTFSPISYAQSCDGCHLGSRQSTPFLPVGAVGVATLEDIRRDSEPGTQWADYWNPNEFSVRGNQISKRPVFHEDPWILHNLKQLRRQLYPGAELADLIRTSPEVSTRDAHLLYNEAIQTLRSLIEALSGNPSLEVQRELADVTRILKMVEQRVIEPFAILDETRFAVSAAHRNGGVNEDNYRTVIDSLTVRCQTCHLLERATLRRVQTEQRYLERAEFSHRAHVTHARCLDCHTRIPIREALASGVDQAPGQDHAGTINLPSIASCKSCHNARGAPTRCTTCHLFHPDKTHWANLAR